jgi:PAS domain-containing protein
MSATWSNSEKIHSLGVLPPVTQSGRRPVTPDTVMRRRSDSSWLTVQAGRADYFILRSDFDFTTQWRLSTKRIGRRQLSASQARLQAHFNNSPDWLTLFRARTDGAFVYEDLNPATERAYGLKRDQILGRRLEEVLGSSRLSCRSTTCVLVCRLARTSATSRDVPWPA